MPGLVNGEDEEFGGGGVDGERESQAGVNMRRQFLRS